VLETLNSIILQVGDPLLSWLLYLPRDAALLIVALGTALILTVVRVFTTNQNLLGRCKKDKARLKQLMREARKSGDKDAVARYRATMAQIGMRTLRAEGKPLLASFVPIAIVACWCWARIAFLPLTSEEPVGVKAYFAVSEIGKLVHIIPQEGIEADNRWIRAIERNVDKDGREVDNGVARWKLSCRQRDGQYVLQIRYNGRIFEKNLIVDGRRYAEPIMFYEDDVVLCSEIDMADHEYHPLNIIPGVPQLFLPPWIVGYLIIVVPLSFLLKPLLRIH
jgi:uncharacterized membrane protein (DUF106 family)